MENEYYGVATTPMDNYLAHYGVRGMKWGVRKAIASGDRARLGRQYAKAQKKLAKLEKQASRTKKYARRAALMGAGAAAAGGLAAAGTGGLARGIGRAGGAVGRGMRSVGGLMARTNIPGVKNAGAYMMTSGRALQRGHGKAFQKFAGASKAVNDWGKGTNLGTALGKNFTVAKKASKVVNGKNVSTTTFVNPLKNVSNNTIARIGAGAVGAGLAAGAARNAYKAATAKKRAAKFRSEMNKAFAGTQYANGGSRTSSKKRRRR